MQALIVGLHEYYQYLNAHKWTLTIFEYNILRTMFDPNDFVRPTGRSNSRLIQSTLLDQLDLSASSVDSTYRPLADPTHVKLVSEHSPSSSTWASFCSADSLPRLFLPTFFLARVVVIFSRHDDKITSTKLYELIQIFVNGCLAKR